MQNGDRLTDQALAPLSFFRETWRPVVLLTLNGAWGIPRMEEPGGLQPVGSQRVGHSEQLNNSGPWTNLSPGCLPGAVSQLEQRRSRSVSWPETWVQWEPLCTSQIFCTKNRTGMYKNRTMAASSSGSGTVLAAQSLSSYIRFCFVFFLGHTVRLVGSQFPNQG